MLVPLIALGSACGGPWHGSVVDKSVALFEGEGEGPAYVDVVAGTPFVHALHSGPPGDVLHLPGEYESVDDLILGWSRDVALHLDTFTTMAVEGSKRTHVIIVHESDDGLAELRRALAERGARMANIEIVNAPLDTMWMRDYGPLVVRTQDGGKRIIDFPYTRSRDDRIPSILAAKKHIALSYVPLDLEGGHIQSDGVGRCIVSDDVVFRNQELGQTEDDVRQLLKDYLGCTVVVIVPFLDGEETGHVDIFLTVTGPGRVLVGHYQRWEDPVNHARLEQVAAHLANNGFIVARVPMPRNDGHMVFRSYTNAVVLDDAVFVPVYRKAHEHELAALAALHAAFPGREIVPVEAEALAALGGALHCITMTVAR